MAKRFMERFDPAAERATRDLVSRAIYSEMREGAYHPDGRRVHRDGPPGAGERGAAVPRHGQALRGPAASTWPADGWRWSPTAHYMMGGVEFEADGTTALPGLYAAGEDCGGVHGANRLGGNGGGELDRVRGHRR